MTEPASLLRILELTRKLAGPLELNELLGEIIDAGREVLEADRGSVFLYDKERRELFITVAHGVKELRFSVDKGIAGQSARTREIINVPDCYDDPRFNRDADLRTGYRTNCLIAVPLIGLEDKLVGVMQLLNPKKGHFDNEDENLCEVLASQAAVVIQRARLLEERLVKLRLERDLDLARQIQIGVLPESLPPCDGYDLAAFSRPADEAGGDIYDVVDLSDRREGLLLLLADATGHGIGPALSVTQVRAMVRVALRLDAGLDDLLVHINRQLMQDLAANRFVTAFFGVLDPTANLVSYHAPGQGPLLIYRSSDGSCEWRDATTFPLGIVDDPPLDPPETVALHVGDLLVLLTDGFYEYQNPQNEQMGKDRVAEAIRLAANQSASQILDKLMAETVAFAQDAPQLDDLTAVIIKRV